MYFIAYDSCLFNVELGGQETLSMSLCKMIEKQEKNRGRNKIKFFGGKIGAKFGI